MDSAENKQLMKELKSFWEASKVEDPLHNYIFDSEIDWATLRHRMDDDMKMKEQEKVHAKRKNAHNLIWNVAIRVAAVFLLAVSFGILSYQFFYTEPVATVEPVLREIIISKGHRGNITLSDGTKVYINSDSKIKIPPFFASDKRVIYLEGQAYLDVAKDPNKPFIIHANGATVRVLGTSFSVKSYPGDTTIETVVEEGVVSLRPEGENIHDGVILTAGILGRLNRNNNKIITKEVDDMDLYLSWRKGYLKFQETPMKEVANQLERKYDINVEFITNDLNEKHLTAELKSRSLDNVLEVIATSLELHYTFDNDTVTFSNKSNE